MNLFKAAYFDVEQIKSDNDTVVLEVTVGNGSILLFLDEEKIQMSDYLNFNLHQAYNENLLQKSMEINREYYTKFTPREVKDKQNFNLRAIAEHTIRFTKGLNPHQLIDDFRLFADARNAVFKEFIKFLEQNNLMKG